MALYDAKYIEQAIKDFQKRMETELDYCKELFDHATVRLMSHKYAYYVCNTNYIEDYEYDLEEKGWFVMGRALGLLKEDDTSPCIDFDQNHPKAKEGIELANQLMGKKWTK